MAYTGMQAQGRIQNPNPPSTYSVDLNLFTHGLHRNAGPGADPEPEPTQYILCGFKLIYTWLTQECKPRGGSRIEKLDI